MKPLKYLILAVLLVVFLGVGIFVGYRLFSPQATKTQITAQVILTALRDRGFLVTQTYIFDEPVTIEKKSGSALKDFFFGQTITARGAMEANLGIDMSKVTADNIQIQDNKVVVTIPKAQIFNVRLIGPLDIKNTQGILKRLLQSDDGFNEAQAELARVAEESAKRQEFIDRATESAKSEVARLVGYVAQGKTIEVIAK
ncbi:MAG: DUF4230 domain-containing protein [Patescibacteria group bacterium]|nr:DUF4230 domain-containing protein [Patescibacteria group bacterium]